MRQPCMLARAGPGDVWTVWTPPPPVVFRRYKKTAALHDAVYFRPVPATFPHMHKFQTQVAQGQVTRSRPVTSPTPHKG